MRRFSCTLSLEYPDDMTEEDVAQMVVDAVRADRNHYNPQDPRFHVDGVHLVHHGRVFRGRA